MPSSVRKQSRLSYTPRTPTPLILRQSLDRLLGQSSYIPKYSGPRNLPAILEFVGLRPGARFADSISLSDDALLLRRWWTAACNKFLSPSQARDRDIPAIQSSD